MFMQTRITSIWNIVWYLLLFLFNFKKKWQCPIHQAAPGGSKLNLLPENAVMLMPCEICGLERVKNLFVTSLWFYQNL